MPRTQTILAARLVLLATSFALLTATGAEARSRRPHRHAIVAPFATPAQPAVFGRNAPADFARSGWIEGASPYNPEGSSNPTVKAW